MPRLIRHLSACDIRSLRRVLIVWAGVLAAQVVVLWLGPEYLGFYNRGPLGYGQAAIVPLILRLALTVLVTAFLVQADSLVGTTAFWRTRPIARWALLASKLASVGLLVVVLPGLVLFGVLLGLGLSPVEAFWGAAVVSAEQAVFVVFAIAAASVTATLAHFVIAGVAGLTVWFLASAIILPLAMAWFRPEGVISTWNRDVFTAFAVTGAVVIVLHQFLTLRTGRSVALGTVWLFAATVAGRLGHPAPAEVSLAPVPASVLSADAVNLQATSVMWGSQSRTYLGAGEVSYLLSGLVATSGEPDAIVLRPVALEASLLVEGRTAARYTYKNAAALVARPVRATQLDQPFRAVRVALGEVDLAVPPLLNRGEYRLALMQTTSDVVSRLNDASGSLDASVTLRAFRYRVVVRSPLAPGSHLVTPFRRATIESIGSRPPLAWFQRHEVGAIVTMRNVSVSGFVSRPFRPEAPSSYYVLHNPGRRQGVLAAAQYDLPVASATVGLLSRGVSTGTGYVEFYRSVSPEVTLNDEWLRGAELLRMEPEDLGVITRPLRIEQLPRK